MSTMIDPGDPLPEPDAQEVARRLRMYMGDKKLSRSQLALSSGITRTSLGAKLDGHVPFTIEEIVSVARAISRSWVWVLTGVDDSAPALMLIAQALDVDVTDLLPDGAPAEVSA
jgi:transcriptional regulator with XRE-family HTH domain